MKKVSSKVFLILLLLSSSLLMAQNFKDYHWQILSCHGDPIARHEAAFIKSGSKFYLMGGRRIQKVSIFDPKTNTWSVGEKPPIELHHFQGFSYKKEIYLVGAMTGNYPRENPLPSSFIYKPDNNTWSKGFKIPKNRLRGSAGAVVYKNKLYLVCGITDGHWDGHVTWFDCYDYRTGKWSVLPDAPRPRDHFNAVVCNDKLYLLGGRVSSGSIGKVFDMTVGEIDVYDFKTGKWSTLDEEIPTERAGCAAIAIGNKIIVAGGESTAHRLAHKEVECLDTKTGKWTELPPLNTGRHGTQLIWYKKKLYMASGCGQRGGKPELDTIECFSK